MIKKCDHCVEEYDMHPGENFCPRCSKYTWIPAKETNTEKKNIFVDNSKIDKK